MRTTLSLKTMLVVALLVANPRMGWARDFQLHDITVQNPWARATPKGAEVAGGYLRIKNTGQQPDKLIGGSCDFAGTVEVHEMATKNGVMTMRLLANGLEIKAGGVVELNPGSFHLMFTQLKKPLKQGDTAKVTLKFEKAGDIPVEFSVESIGAKSGGKSGMEMNVQ
jgi:periplasmic copper chaperone A